MEGGPTFDAISGEEPVGRSITVVFMYLLSLSLLEVSGH